MAHAGKNKKKCDLYKSQNRREINKQKKLKRVLKQQPNNLQIKKLIK